jgi:hypothetical protein
MKKALAQLNQERFLICLIHARLFDPAESQTTGRNQNETKSLTIRNAKVP